jgi:hypothetical protein
MKPLTLLSPMILVVSLAGATHPIGWAAESGASGSTGAPALAMPGVPASTGYDAVDWEARYRGHGDHPVVPIAFFVFLLVLFLGRRALIERTNQRRLEVLRTLVEKGQPVPEAVVREILAGGPGERGCGMPGEEYRSLRRGYGLSLAGGGLLVFALVNHGHPRGALIAGIVLAGLGLGNLLARRHRPDRTG